MKKSQILLLCAIFLFSLKAYCQKDYDTYDNTYLNKTFKIQISLDDNNQAGFYVNAFSFDSNAHDGGFNLKAKRVDGFIENLKQAQLKYQDWLATAKANNVKSLSKEIKIKAQRLDGYFKYGKKWHFDFYVSPSFEFKIIESKGKVSHLLIVRTGKMEASDNKYIDSDGFALIFSSSDEITQFCNKFSNEKIAEFINKPKAEDLFKD